MVDLGAGGVKAGYAGEDTPKAFFPSVRPLARPACAAAPPALIYTVIDRLHRWWAAAAGRQQLMASRRSGSASWGPRRWASGEMGWRCDCRE